MTIQVTLGAGPGKQKEFWLKDPSWLNHESSWPTQPEVSETSDALKEKIPRTEKQLLAKQTDQDTNDLDRMLIKYPYWKLMRITAYITRFVEHCHKKKKTTCLALTSQETDEAEKLWVQRAQASGNLAMNTYLKKERM